MIRFIDITTGNVYNGDMPYVHWFEGKQSIGLNYDKQFIVLSDVSNLHIILNSEVFCLIDSEKLIPASEKTFFDKTYLDLEEIKTNELILSPSTEYGRGYYIYNFNIVACGKYVGEITEDLYINDEQFTIGADFIDENEALSVNLKNFGMELSNEVQRAIYEKRIDEQKTDFILLNRKFKELLNEYINVIANKGSYKSIINSLKWFEYGELTQLYEYWKHPEPNKEYLSKRDITQFITKKTENLLYSMQKTAYMGISAALDKVAKTEDGSTQYDNTVDESKIGEEPTFWGYSPLQYNEFFANAQWCTIYNKDKTVTFRLAVDREIMGFAPQISFEGTYVGLEYKNGYYEYTTSEKYEYGELLPEVWFFWLACYYGVIRVDIPYTKIGSKNNKGDVILPSGWNWVISGGNDNMLSLLNEPNPLLENVSMLWSKNEMSLKMVLLGNFFATYFMPIHLDLIHSTIENIVYTQTIKMPYGALFKRFDAIDNIHTIDCKLEKVYHLKNVETYTNINTPFGFLNKKLTDEDQDLFIVGVEEQFSITGTNPTEANKGYNLQHFKGIGVLVPFNCTICEIGKSATITEGEIHIYKYENYNKNGIEKQRVIHKLTRNTSNVPHISTNGKLEIKFNLLIQEIGEYKVQLAFRRSDGALYTRTFDFSVDGEITPTLSMYRLVPKYPNPAVISTKLIQWLQNEGDENKDVIQLGSVADYVMNPVQQFKVTTDRNLTSSNVLDFDPYLLYMQFISTSKETTNTVHNHQVIIVKFSEPDRNGEYAFSLIKNNKIIRINYVPKDKLIDDSADKYKSFIWFVLDKYGRIENDPYYTPSSDPNVLAEFGGNTYKYIIGISKYPNTHDNARYVFEGQKSKNIVDRWSRFMFIPYFYKLEKIGETSYFERVAQNKTQEEIFADRNAENTYTIDKTDVVCFLPDIKCIKRPSDFMWKFVCKTTENSIEPITYRNVNGTNEFPTILRPLFGRYDFRILPEIGYYDVVMNYKMDNAQLKNETKTISSQFIVSRDKIDRSIKPTDTNIA